MATSGPVDGGQLEQSLTLLEEWGLRPVEYPSVRERHDSLPYLAGSDAQRARDLQEAWCDDDIAAVFCVRGGYGSVRLLDLLNVDSLRRPRAKRLFGSSDVTAVHEFWREQLGVATWFTPMLATNALLQDPAAVASLHRAVFEPSLGRTFMSARAEGLVPGTATGTLIGGNLSLLAMTIGAKSRPPVGNRECIALLEDVGEDAYRIDGLLMKLLRARWFDGVSGIALGSWLNCGEPGLIRHVVDDLLVPLGVPLAWQLGFGHDTAAPSIPLGLPAMLEVGDQPVLTIMGPPETTGESHDQT